MGGTRMVRTAVDFFRLTGGFRLGETHEQLTKRIEEIVALEARLKALGRQDAEAERLRLRLRQLRDVDHEGEVHDRASA